MNRVWPALLSICAIVASIHPAQGATSRGKAVLQTMCGRCHAVGTSGSSPHPDAPPFRTFGDEKLYDSDFAERLENGLSTVHPDMPSFHFSREDAEAAVDYLRSIQVKDKPKPNR